MKKEETEKPYFLLKEPESVDDDLFNSLLGLAVENPYKPLRGAYRPRHPEKPRDGIDYLYPSGYVVCKDYSRVEKKTKTWRSHSKLQRIAKLSLEKGGSEKADLAAAAFRRISMRNARTMIEDLLRKPDDTDPGPILGNSTNDGLANKNDNPPEAQDAPAPAAEVPANANSGSWVSSITKIPGQLAQMVSGPSAPTTDPATEEATRKTAQKAARERYRKQVLELLSQQDDGKLAIITSFITCSEMSKNLEKVSKTAVDVAAGTGPAGLGSYIEVELGAAYSRTHDVGTSGAYVGEYLIACSYLPLYLVSKERELKLHIPFTKRQLKLSPIHAADGVDIVIAPEEMWRVGDDEMSGGNMAASLSVGSLEADEPSEASKEEDIFILKMLYHDDEVENDEDADRLVDSEVEGPGEGDTESESESESDSDSDGNGEL